MPIKVYVNPQTPGVVEGTEWTTVCHSKTPFVWVRHSPYRELSRWTHTERKRPFTVTLFYRTRAGLSSSEISAHKTLEAALKAANKFANEQ